MESGARTVVVQEESLPPSLERELALRLERFLRQTWKDSELSFLEHKVSRTGRSGILSLLAAEFGSPRIGLWNHDLLVSKNGELRTLHLVVKCKAEDALLTEVAERVAETLHPGLRGKGTFLLQALGMLGSGRRESSLYGTGSPIPGRYRPRCFFSGFDEESGEWVIVMEHLSGPGSQGSFLPGEAWNERHLSEAAATIAEVHSISYGDIDSLTASRSLSRVDSSEFRDGGLFLFSALFEMNRRKLRQWLGDDCDSLGQRLLNNYADVQAELARSPRAMIHNDFQPRNICFRVREKSRATEVCIIDWELGTIAAPEHDLAELLCFALPLNAGREDAQRIREVHRQKLEREIGDGVSDQVSKR